MAPVVESHSGLIVGGSEVDFLYQAASACVGKKLGRDSTWQIAPVLTSIPYRDNSISSLEGLRFDLQRRIPQLAEHGEKRARRAYLNMNDTLTKPSYVARVFGPYEGLGGSQHNLLSELFAAEPRSGGLVFSVFHPKDLRDRRRPGYVPCLVAGSFVFHHDELHVNAFFRSQSIVEFGVFDLLFLRRLQAFFVATIQDIPRATLPKREKLPTVRPGPLNLQFGRIIIQQRLARNRRSHLRREDVMPQWLDMLLELNDGHTGRVL